MMTDDYVLISIYKEIQKVVKAKCNEDISIEQIKEMLKSRSRYIAKCIANDTPIMLSRFGRFESKEGRKRAVKYLIQNKGVKMDYRELRRNLVKVVTAPPKRLKFEIMTGADNNNNQNE